MTELEFESQLIEQLSTGLVMGSGPIAREGKAYGNMQVYKSKLWKYEPSIKTTQD